jgi:hypothetical protein
MDDWETPIEVYKEYGIAEVLARWVMDGDAEDFINNYINGLIDEINQLKRRCISDCIQY